MSFKVVSDFENEVAHWFGAPYGIAVDCCTHGVELCLRYKNIQSIEVPKRTYLSIPFLADKLGIELKWKDEKWKDYYKIGELIFMTQLCCGKRIVIYLVHLCVLVFNSKNI